MSAAITTPQYQPIDADEVAQMRRDLTAEDKRLRRSGETEAERTVRRAGLLATVAGMNVLTGDPLYTGEDVLGWLARAVELGCTVPQIGPEAIADVAHLVRVPNAKLRDEYERRVAEGEGESVLADMARALGLGSDDRPDTTGALRVLGVEPSGTAQTNGNGDKHLPTLRLFISYEQAVALADALDLDYHDLGV